MARPRKTTSRTPAEPAVVAPFLIKVARVGGSVLDICLNGDKTVGAALAAANLTPEGTIRVNGRVAKSEDALNTGDIVTVAGRISGGSF